MARKSKTSTSGSSEHEDDLLASYRRRVKRAFRSGGRSAPAVGTAVANPGRTKVEGARQARHPGSKPPEGENS